MAGHPPKAASSGNAPWVLLGGFGAGTAAIGVIIVLQLADIKYVAVALTGALFVLALPLISNLRLFCLYAIITLAPFGLRLTFLPYPHMGGAGATYIEAVDPFLALLLYFHVRERLKGFRRGYRFPRPFKIWVALIVLGLGSVIFMDVLRVTAFNEVIRMTKLLLLAALICNEVVTRRQFKHAIVAVTLGVILQAGLAIVQYLRGKQLGLEFLGEASDENIKTLSDATLLTGEFVNRVGGLLGHANLLAAYLALYLPMAVALFLAPISRRLKVLLSVALLLGQPVLVLTLSRTGWIDFSVALMMVLALGALHPISRRKFLLFRVGIVTLTAAVALALSPHIMQRLFETDPNAVVYRIKWLETARAMILDHPLLGVGLNTYVFRQLPYGDDKTPTEMHDRYGDLWPAVHNAWMLTWTEQGTIGFILFVAFHISVIVLCIRNLRIRDPMMHALGVGLFAGFVAVMIDGLASFFVRQEATARMYWIAIGLILAVGYWRRANEEGELALARLFAASDRPQADGVPSRGGRWLPARTSPLR